MCSDCEEDEPMCSFCGDSCYGNCDDPDTCPSCWIFNHDPMEVYMDFFDDDTHDECLEKDCRCACHDGFYEDMGMRLVDGVRQDEESDGPPFVREGVFPFLKLAGELREKIYGFAFLQDGNRRESQYHRGTIHTALLRSCRQVYKEAGSLPLHLNTLNFGSALYALNYLGFFLKPGQAHLITSIHIEFTYHEFSNTSWILLFRQLAKLPITHLGLTIKGPCSKEAFIGHKCFINRFASSMKGIKTFDVIIGSTVITKKVKEEIQEEMREVLIKGYKRLKKPKSKAKRSATSENGEMKPTKKFKKAVQKTKHQTKLVISPKSTRLGIISQRAEKEAMLAQYDQLKQYAISIDLDAALVKIRLEDARKAAEAPDRPKFEQLAQDILVTLEERYDRITAARKNVPTFPKVAHTVAPVEAPSSQESIDSWDTQSSSQLPM